MGVLRIDRDALWRELFTLEPRAADAKDAAQDSGAHLALLQRARTAGQLEPLRAMLTQRIGYWLRSDIVPAFWRFFDGYDALLQRSVRAKRERHAFSLFCAEQLTLALQFADEAFAHCIELASLFDRLDNEHRTQRASMRDELTTHFRCLVFDDAAHKERFHDVLVLFFSMSFHQFRGAETYRRLASQPIRLLLVQLEWMHVAEPALLRVVHSQVRARIRATCGDEFSEKVLDRVVDWACSELLPWLDDLFHATASAAQSSSPSARQQQWRDVISQHVLQEFGSLRIAQLFEIIKEYPDSVPALDDLRRCLERTHQHDDLVSAFRTALRTRLLQPGANTSEILDIYVSTIKAFRILDPKGVLLEALSEPVKEYLRQRKDTVRCIVLSLTDDQHGDLFDELRRNNMRLIQQDDDSDDDEDASPDDWEPDPIEADPTKTSRSRNSDDILRILVNIYGSRELFVNEYRMMLADKLLQNVAYNTDRDVQTLELLKLRFGDDALQMCEIMVRDIDDSKRINANVSTALAVEQQHRTTAAGAVPVDATIVSQHFWPPFQSDDLALHPTVASAVDAYKRAYGVLRNPRSLAWHPSLGSVQLAIELNGVEREFTVSPIQATMILHFDEREHWSIDELAAVLEISDDALLKHVTVWINHGLLTFSSDRKTLVASRAFQDSHDANESALMDEPETAVSSDAQEAEDLRLLETYIVGMLSNFGSLPIQRIHNMLSTFARSGAQPYDKTISGLAVILGKLVDRGKLELVAGQYQRAK